MKLIIQPQRQRRLADSQSCRKNNVRPQLLTDPCPKPDIIKMHSQSSLSFKQYSLPSQEIPRFCIFYKISFLFIEHMFYIDLRIDFLPCLSIGVSAALRTLFSKPDGRASYPKKEKPESIPRALPCPSPADYSPSVRTATSERRTESSAFTCSPAIAFPA